MLRLVLWPLGLLVRFICFFLPCLIPKPALAPGADGFTVCGRLIRAVYRGDLSGHKENILIEEGRAHAVRLLNNPGIYTIEKKTACTLSPDNLRPELRRLWPLWFIIFILYYCPWWAIFEIARQYTILSSDEDFTILVDAFMTCKDRESIVVIRFGDLMKRYYELMNMHGGLNQSQNVICVILGCLNQLTQLPGNEELGFSCTPDAFFDYWNNGRMTTLFALEFKTAKSHAGDPMQHIVQVLSAMARRNSRVGVSMSPCHWSLTFGTEGSAHCVRGNGSYKSLLLTIITASLLGQHNPV